MWAMVLAYLHAFPGALDQGFFAKAVQPKLCTMLRYNAMQIDLNLPPNQRSDSFAHELPVSGRNACYGTAGSSFPAVLPFVALLPPDLQSIKLHSTLLDSVWSGWEAAPDVGSQIAAGQCFEVQTCSSD